MAKSNTRSTADNNVVEDASGNVTVDGQVTADKLKSTNSAGLSPAEVDIVSGATWRFRSNPVSGTNSYGLDIVKGSAGTDVKMSIDSSGNVGIGADSPQRNLHIHSPAATSTKLQITNSSTGSSSDGDGFQIGIGNDGTASIEQRENKDLTFSTNNSERLRLDSSGNLGLGVTPESWNTNFTALQVGTRSTLANTVGGNGEALTLSHNYYNDGTAERYIATDEASIYSQYAGGHKFRVAPSGTADSAISWTTAMTIANNGEVEIGNFTSGGSATGVLFGVGGSDPEVQSSCTSTNVRSHYIFYNPNGAVGSITTSGSSTSYNTSSDYRLKEDVQPVANASDRLMALKPVNFAWKADGSRVDGFLAHEAQEVIPEAATGTKDAMRDEDYEVSPALGEVFTVGSEAGFTEVSAAIVASPAYYDVDGVQIKAEVLAQAAVHEATEAIAEVIHSSDVEKPETLEEGQQWRETTAQVMGTKQVPDMQGIDQSKLVPLLTAALQEALARIEALEAT